MGQKVNPISFRTGIKGCLKWPSKWFSSKNYANLALEDIAIRGYLEKHYSHTKIDRILIERSAEHLKVIIVSAMPGILIGKGGKDIDVLRTKLSKFINRDTIEVSVHEIKDVYLSAKVISKTISELLERRVAFKKATKKAATDIIRAGAKGVKICVSGRLDGAEIARSEWVRGGSVPLHTLRADIDYGFSEAQTTYGVVGVRVWICRGLYSTAKL
jgi:small subunit ribosomal protein S3